MSHCKPSLRGATHPGGGVFPQNVRADMQTSTTSHPSRTASVTIEFCATGTAVPRYSVLGAVHRSFVARGSLIRRLTAGDTVG